MIYKALMLSVSEAVVGDVAPIVFRDLVLAPLDRISSRMFAATPAELLQFQVRGDAVRQTQKQPHSCDP
jgi:hypothetical protein